MANIGLSSTAGLLNGENGAAYTVQRSPGTGYGVSATTGILAAALAANSSVFVMRNSPTLARNVTIERLRIAITTLTAFTTPVTAARRLALFRGVGANASGGTQVTCVNAQKLTDSTDCVCTTANGGDMRVSTTAALTVTGITFETDPFRTIGMSHIGASGGFIERVFEFDPGKVSPLILKPGQLIAIRNPVLMDAAGTFQVEVNVDWNEVTP